MDSSSSSSSSTSRSGDSPIHSPGLEKKTKVDSQLEKAKWQKPDGKLSHVEKIEVSEDDQVTSKTSELFKTTPKQPFFREVLTSAVRSSPFGKFTTTKGLGSKNDLKTDDKARQALIEGLGGEEIKFGSKYNLEGMYFHADAVPEGVNQKTILLCTGSHGPCEKYAYPLVKAFKEMGHNVMIFNYEGFGASEGKKSEKGVYRSVEEAYKFLVEDEDCKIENIVPWGYSLGSGAVSHLASKVSGKMNIVIDRGFSSMSKVAKQEFDNPLMKKVAEKVTDVVSPFDNFSKLAGYQGQVFIAYGKEDTMGPNHAQNLRDTIGEGAQVREVPGGHHHEVPTEARSVDVKPLWFSVSAEDIENSEETFKALLKTFTDEDNKITEMLIDAKNLDNSIESIIEKAKKEGLHSFAFEISLKNLRELLERQAARQEIEGFLNSSPQAEKSEDEKS